jgi:hypothetical protein
LGVGSEFYRKSSVRDYQSAQWKRGVCDAVAVWKYRFGFVHVRFVVLRSHVFVFDICFGEFRGRNSFKGGRVVTSRILGPGIFGPSFELESCAK